MDCHYDRRTAGIPSMWRKTDSGNSLPATSVMMDSSLHRGHRYCIEIGFEKPKIFQHNFITLLTDTDDSDGRNHKSYSLILNKEFMTETTFLLPSNARGWGLSS